MKMKRILLVLACLPYAYAFGAAQAVEDTITVKNMGKSGKYTTYDVLLASKSRMSRSYTTPDRKEITANDIGGGTVEIPSNAEYTFNRPDAQWLTSQAILFRQTPNEFVKNFTWVTVPLGKNNQNFNVLKLGTSFMDHDEYKTE